MTSILCVRRLSPLALESRLILAATLSGATGCQSDSAAEEVAGTTGTTGELCEADPADGVWNGGVPTEGGVMDWNDVGPMGDSLKDGFPGLIPHHPGLSAVHTIHLPTGELMMFHGRSEERVWPFELNENLMRWHPVPFPVSRTNPDHCSYTPLVGSICYADIFCSGHVVLSDGRLLVAGGNVDGQGVGIPHTFTYNPYGQPLDGSFPDDDVADFGWKVEGQMTIDRWYPTLTALPDGNVLISSGSSLRARSGITCPVMGA